MSEFTYRLALRTFRVEPVKKTTLYEDLDKEGDGDEDGEDEHAAQTIQVERPSSAPSNTGVIAPGA